MVVFFLNYSGDVMWEINNTFQVLSFIYSLVLGAIFSLLYDVIKSFRLTIKPSATLVFILDIIYFIFIAFISFLFYLSVTDGEIRFYILLGLFLGFLIIRFTISKLFVFLLTKIFGFIFSVFKKVNYCFFTLADTISSVFLKIFNKITYFIKKIKIILKKDLKNDSVLLYTIEE